LPADKVFTDGKAFAAELRSLRTALRSRVKANRAQRGRRAVLTKRGRAEVLRKTGGRCHICGGLIDGDKWDADHVMAHATGGTHAADNYLPAHAICNGYRKHYESDEFQWILKLGVWLRTQIANDEPLGVIAAKKFCEKERSRAGRKKSPATIRPTGERPTATAEALSSAARVINDAGEVVG
jgi:hypothetical protein